MPGEDPTDGYAERIPLARPPGLRLSTLRRTWFRLDGEPPSAWSWRPFTTPRHRFDSAGATARVRYAGDALRVAMRERFDASGRRVRAVDLDLHVVALAGSVRVLDLRHDRVLDALGLDDQISTSRAPGVWAAGQLLGDRVRAWFGERCHGLVYRSRTTPQRSANLAFGATAPLAAKDLGRLGDHPGLLAASVLSDGFTIQGWPD